MSFAENQITSSNVSFACTFTEGNGSRIYRGRIRAVPVAETPRELLAAGLREYIVSRRGQPDRRVTSSWLGVALVSLTVPSSAFQTGRNGR